MATTPKVHPLADIFPMWPNDELDELAADIKANGQLYPIILDHDGLLIDGRNRLAACLIAGVEPKTERLPKIPHDDPNVQAENEEARVKAIIASANVLRRSASKGQKAMSLAMLYPDPKRGRGHVDPVRTLLEEKGWSSVSFSRVKEARLLLRLDAQKADDVAKGRATLDVALAEVDKKRKAQEQWDQRMADLRSAYPDLADDVETEEQLKAAEATANRRDDERAKARDDAKRFVIFALQAVTVFNNAGFPDIKKQFDDELIEAVWDDLQDDARTRGGLALYLESLSNLQRLCKELFK